MPIPRLMYCLGYRNEQWGKPAELTVLGIITSEAYGSIEAVHHCSIILDEHFEFWKNRYEDTKAGYPEYVVTKEKALEVIRAFLAELQKEPR